MANLANVYAELRRNYAEIYMITYAAAPSYLKRIVGPTVTAEKIIFLYEEDRLKSRIMNHVSPSKLLIKRDDDLDVTGSPLKDECIIDAIDDGSIDFNLIAQNPWNLEEEYHKGIALDKARNILSADGFQRGENVRGAEGSVWILCNGLDEEKTLLFQYEFASGFNSRGLITYEGVVQTHSVNTMGLLQRHYALFRSAGAQIETIIENTYQMKSNVVLKCSWSTAAAVPSLIDLSSCDVMLSQRFRVADCNPLTQEFMNQLRILMLIRDDIVIYKQEHEQEAGTVRRDPIYRCGRGIEIEELRESVNKVMTEISGFTEIIESSAAEYDIEAVVQRAKQRHLTDLTDKLWNILKCCSSYKDLKTAFNIVFQCAAKCNIVNTPTNKNRLAEIITEVANRRLAIPCLSGSEPLELLLEIGIEKLYKDYEYIYGESKICNASDLKKKNTNDEMSENEPPLNVRKSIRNAMRPEAASRKTFLHSNVKSATKFSNDDVMSFKNSNFNDGVANEQLSKLLQIHSTLEHLLMIQINLNLSNVYNDVCDQLLKKPVRTVNSIDDSLEDEIEINLSAHDVREHLQGKEPNARRITFKSKNKYRYVKTTFYYSLENIFPPGISECFQVEDKECASNNFYYSWLYRKIKTICPSNAGA